MDGITPITELSTRDTTGLWVLASLSVILAITLVYIYWYFLVRPEEKNKKVQ